MSTTQSGVSSRPGTGDGSMGLVGCSTDKRVENGVGKRLDSRRIYTAAQRSRGVDVLRVLGVRQNKPPPFWSLFAPYPVLAIRIVVTVLR